MYNIKLFSLAVFISVSVFAQAQIKLSDQARIDVITFGPYQGELYSAFGHSGIRVVDPINGIDVLFNYGIFDFNQPNFYINFARGFLNYRLAVQDYQLYKDHYIRQNRYVHEQVLNLSREEKQKVFKYLQWNAQPENMHYYYDYFYDNCATRIRDVINTALDSTVVFDGSYVTTDYTIRDLTDVYLKEQPWGDLGIDICLGLPMDKKATPYMYMFLPDYIESSFNNATIRSGGISKTLVKNTIIAYESRQETTDANWLTPLVAFSMFLILTMAITAIAYVKDKNYFGFDIFVFGVVGLIGWVLLLLWMVTDHNAAARNMNLLWAVPFHIPLIFLLLRKNKPPFIKNYFLGVNLVLILSLLLWFFLPQDLPDALIPFVVALAIRSFYIKYRLKSQ